MLILEYFFRTRGTYLQAPFHHGTLKGVGADSRLDLPAVLAGRLEDVAIERLVAGIFLEPRCDHARVVTVGAGDEGGDDVGTFVVEHVSGRYRKR
jgi:hypothetical protein